MSQLTKINKHYSQNITNQFIIDKYFDYYDFIIFFSKNILNIKSLKKMNKSLN